MTSYNKVRRVSFAAYILLSVLFAWLLIHLGRKDIERAAAFSEKEKAYIESLMKCSSSIDDAMGALRPYGLRSKSELASFSSKFDALRKSMNTLRSETHEEKVAADLQRLRAKSTMIASALDSASRNIAEDSGSDSELILREDFSAISAALVESAGIVHGLVASEYEQSGFWQRQSLFFFKRLQYLLVTFFVLTTVFIVLSSSYSGILLRNYLGKLSEGTKQVSSGNLRYRFGGIEPDEMGSLMADFNSMAARLEQQTHELKKMNRELEEKARQLVEANLHKDRFFANMSHELRTPLNSIIGFSDLNIGREDYSREKLVENSRKVLAAAEHLLSLISGLLDLAKADAGVLSPVKDVHDVSETLSGVVEMLRPLAEQRNLRIELECAQSASFPYDEKMIKQVFINLISNAIKFTHEGGVKIRMKRTDDSISVEIEDSGIGISEEDQKKIFNDFHRVENGLTSNYEGVGLGLALSRRLARLHGGDISLSSIPGKGSVFTVKLPTGG